MLVHRQKYSGDRSRVRVRWLEDTVAVFRAFVSLCRLLFAGGTTLAQLGETREGLHDRVGEFSTKSMRFPDE